MVIEQGELFEGGYESRKPDLRTQIDLHPAVANYVAAFATGLLKDTLQRNEQREVSSIWRGGDVFAPLGLNFYPNHSTVIRYRSNGEGLPFYDTMLGTDPDLRGLFQDIIDDLLHNEPVIREEETGGGSTGAKERAEFIRFAFGEIPHFQNFVDHGLSCHARGFSVNEKMYRYVTRGKWAGAVVLDEIYDREQVGFNFAPDRSLLFRSRDNPDPGERVPQDKHIVMVHGSNSNPWGHAVLDDCYAPWYLKHFAMKYQAIFFEKWAMPTPRAKYKHSSTQKVNEQRLNAALAALAAFQADSGVAIPEEIEMDLIESARQGAVSYESYINQLTEMESRAVTGQILTMFGAKGGSYALGKVHEKRVTNKVEKLSAFIDSQISRNVIRDLIDRNFGPQDTYPRWEYLSMGPLEKQAHAEVEKALQQNGHVLSRSFSAKFFQIVSPTGPDDVLTPPPEAQASQTLPVNPTLAAEQNAERVRIALASPGLSQLHAASHGAATAHRKKLDARAAETTKEAKPAIRKAMKAIAAPIRKLKSVKAVKRTHLHEAARGADLTPLGTVMQKLLAAPGDGAVAQMASENNPPEISTSAKLALALQVVEIIEQIYQAAQDAPEGMDPDAFVDSLLDPNGAALDDRIAGTFGAVHPTNIATIATARLREQLADPAFRKAHPYGMIVVTNPNARLGHRVLNGFIMTAEEMRWSPNLPPFEFGCDCSVVMLTVEQARAAGLTGANPVGTMEEFLGAQGIRRGPFGDFSTPGGSTVYPGTVPGFTPAWRGADEQVQLGAIRRKAAELQNIDPEGWAKFTLWLLWLFNGTDILKQDPQEDENANAA